jgi:hypothetical protein
MKQVPQLVQERLLAHAGAKVDVWYINKAVGKCNVRQTYGEDIAEFLSWFS